MDSMDLDSVVHKHDCAAVCAGPMRAACCVQVHQAQLLSSSLKDTDNKKHTAMQVYSEKVKKADQELLSHIERCSAKKTKMKERHENDVSGFEVKEKQMDEACRDSLLTAHLDIRQHLTAQPLRRCKCMQSK